MNMAIMLLLGGVGSIAVFYCSKNAFSTKKNFLIGFLTLLFSSLFIFSLVFFYRLKTGDVIETVDLMIGGGCMLGVSLICGVKCAITQP